jgi:hypothetical protein
MIKSAQRRARSVFTSRHWLLGFATLLVGVMLALFLNVLLSGEALPPLPKRFERAHSASFPLSCESSEEKKEEGGEGDSKAHVRLVVVGFNPSSASITANVSLCFGSEVWKHLYASTGTAAHPIGSRERPGFKPVLDSAEHLISSYARLHVNIVYSSSSFERIGTTASLGALFRLMFNAESNRSVALGPVVLPVVATPQKYPFDQYGLSGGFLVRDYLDEKVFYSVPNPRGRIAGELLEIPATVEVYSAPNIAPFSLLAGGSNTGEVLRLERSTTRQAYVIAVALIPLFLALLLLLGVARSSAAGIGTAILGIGGVLLAILPIRSVLVPAELNELTLVDYWLAVEMAGLAALAAFGVWRVLGHRDKTGPPR